MKSFKQQCIALRQKDKTLSEIMTITGRKKTSVWFHIKDIPLSDKKQRQISQNSAARARQVAAKRRGVSKRKYQTFASWSPKHVLFIAHLMFGGEMRRTTCGYSNRSNALVKRVEDLFTRVYTHQPTRRFDQRSGVTGIHYYNVALAAYLTAKADELLTDIPQLSRACQREFLRAFFDDEGCMDFNQSTRRIRGYQKDQRILQLVVSLLRNFNVAARIQEPNEVVISGKKNLQSFQQEINFSDGVRLNPKRSNSIWKKNLEKRELLQMAIDSYQA